MQVTSTEPLTALMPARYSGPLRLFVVEDSNAVPALWRTVSPRIAGLSLAGVFHRATAAIVAIRREPPDVVLLDINLGDGQGMEVLRVVAAEYPLTKVIVVSDCAAPAHWKYFTKAGAYAFYDKNHELAIMGRMLERLAKYLLPEDFSCWQSSPNGSSTPWNQSVKNTTF
ncbi:MULTISPECIES: response regulator [unclassified Pseudomonas]|uniref:response regulator n=1 Tax=unclassified Pseudomonas TaxID=196821 RepID=UPI000D355E75|nr:MULTISPECIES: response regulator [unclassified Pseudomonas]PTR28018.1 response regulator receiver domain-containing protein [Pseudomonas sp. GV085]